MSMTSTNMCYTLLVQIFAWRKMKQLPVVLTVIDIFLLCTAIYGILFLNRKVCANHSLHSFWAYKQYSPVDWLKLNSV